jgi:asparagine N-glycosylation enzyme membrane subunit Stt3
LYVATAKHNQVSDLAYGGHFPIGVYIPAHTLLCRLKALPGLVVHGVHPVRIDLAGGVERITGSRVGGGW